MFLPNALRPQADYFANKSINPTAKKLRFLVPSALRAPAAG